MTDNPTKLSRDELDALPTSVHQLEQHEYAALFSMALRAARLEKALRELERDAKRYLHHVRCYYEGRHAMVWGLGWNRETEPFNQFKLRYDAAIDAAMKET